MIRQSINYHVIDDHTMAFIYHVCSTRAYLRCIVAIKTDSSLHGLTIIRRHLPRDPSMNIHPLYATGLCMLLIQAVTAHLIADLERFIYVNSTDEISIIYLQRVLLRMVR